MFILTVIIFSAFVSGISFTVGIEAYNMGRNRNAAVLFLASIINMVLVILNSLTLIGG